MSTADKSKNGIANHLDPTGDFTDGVFVKGASGKSYFKKNGGDRLDFFFDNFGEEWSENWSEEDWDRNIRECFGNNNETTSQDKPEPKV